VAFLVDDVEDPVHARAASLAGTAGVTDAVLAAGTTPDGGAEFVKLLNGATMLVLPSLLEGFGLPAVEAMACGLPVVASRRGSLPEVIGDAGSFFDPLSPDDMARAILRLIEDPTLQADLRKRALARAAEFTWERAAELAEASFRKCL
jgi:glycosyltransferase involved in cell wall biosynthesis